MKLEFAISFFTFFKYSYCYYLSHYLINLSVVVLFGLFMLYPNVCIFCSIYLHEIIYSIKNIDYLLLIGS